MAQDIHPVVHPVAHGAHHEGDFENVCLTGTVVMAAFGVGCAITALIMWWALFAHH